MIQHNLRRATLATGLLTLLASFHAHAIPILQFVPPDSAAGVGDSLSIDIMATDVTDLFAYQSAILYDPTILSATAIIEGTFLSSAGGTVFLGDVDTSPGGVLFFSILLEPTGPGGANGSGVLATLDFTTLAAGTSALTFSNWFLFNSAGDVMETAAVDGTVAAVDGTVSVPEPDSLALLAIALLAGCYVFRSKHPVLRA